MVTSILFLSDICIDLAISNYSTEVTTSVVQMPFQLGWENETDQSEPSLSLIFKRREAVG
jgi:hypothetical protein